MIFIFSIGMAIGLFIALFIGPISVLCIRRSIAEGFTVGFVSGLGAAVADVLYGSIAALGLTMVSDFLLHHHFIIRFLGGLYLIYLGALLLIKKTVKNGTVPSHMSLVHAFTSIFLLTLSNPFNIITFAAALTIFNIPELTLLSGCILLTGIFLGSCLWWFIVAGTSSFLGSRLTDQALHIVNTIAGAIIIVCGIASLVSLLLY